MINAHTLMAFHHRLYTRRIAALSVLIVLSPCLAQAQIKSNLPIDSIWNSKASVHLLDDIAFSLLKTHPHLAAARHWIGNDSQVDMARNIVRTIPDQKGFVREISCDALADGIRQKVLDSDRVVITLPCVLRGVKPTTGPEFDLIAVIEKAGDKVAVELRMPSDAPRAETIGTMLPSALPARIPALSFPVESLQMYYSVLNRWRSVAPGGAIKLGPHGGYTFYMGFLSQAEPSMVVGKLKADLEASGAKVAELANDVQVESLQFDAREEWHTTTVNLFWAQAKDRPGWTYEMVVMTVLTSLLEKPDPPKTTVRQPAPLPKRLPSKK